MEADKVKIDTEKCVGCGLCVKICPAHNLKIENKKAKTIMDECVFCGHCTAVCPKRAVSIGDGDREEPEKNREVRLNPQTVLEVIRFRRSVRRFQSKAIPNETIEDILEAGRLTHTAKNAQDVSFIVLQKEKDRIEQMAVQLFKKIKPFADIFSPMAKNNRIDENFFFFQAPIAIIVLAKNKTNGILAAQNMEYVAEAHGLGVLFSGYFTTAANLSRKIKKAIRKPRGKRVAMTLVLGYPAVNFLRPPKRKELNVQWL